MNTVELVKDLLHFVWDAVLNWAQTPEGAATLAEIVSDFGLSETPEAPAPAPTVRQAAPVSSPQGSETEAERRARLGGKE